MLLPKNFEQKHRKGIYIFSDPCLCLPRIRLTGSLSRASAETAPSEKPSEIEREVMELFEQLRNPLLRYALSFGIPVHDAEEIVQEVFLSLFRHLQLRRSRQKPSRMDLPRRA